MGFDVVDVVGSLSYSNDLGPIGYTLNAHRRPISSSVLAFAGQKILIPTPPGRRACYRWRREHELRQRRS